MRNVFRFTVLYATRAPMSVALILVLSAFGCGKEPSKQSPPASVTNSVSTSSTPPPSEDRAREVLREYRKSITPLTNTNLSVEELVTQFRGATHLAARTQTLDALAKRHPDKALETMNALFETETNPNVKGDILGAMASIRHSNTVASLVVGLHTNQTLEVRLAAIEELRFYDDQSAIPFLEPLLQDPDSTIRAKATEAIDLLNVPRISKEQLDRLRQRKQGPPAP